MRPRAEHWEEGVEMSRSSPAPSSCKLSCPSWDTIICRRRGDKCLRKGPCGVAPDRREGRLGVVFADDWTRCGVPKCNFGGNGVRHGRQSVDADHRQFFIGIQIAIAIEIEIGIEIGRVDCQRGPNASIANPIAICSLVHCQCSLSRMRLS